MLKINSDLADRYGLLVVKSYKVHGKIGIYKVELLSNGELECNCIAGSMQKECRHKEFVKKVLL